MIINIIKSYRNVVAICDKELLGKYFEEGEFQIEIKESFFGNTQKTEDEIISTIKDMKMEDATFNIVGEKSIQAAIKAGVIKEENTRKIQGVPFALILM